MGYTKKRRMCAKIAKYLLLVKKLKIAANNFFIGIFLYSIFHWKSIVWWSVLGWIDKFYITFCNKKKKKNNHQKLFMTSHMINVFYCFVCILIN